MKITLAVALIAFVCGVFVASLWHLNKAKGVEIAHDKAIIAQQDHELNQALEYAGELTKEIKQNETAEHTAAVARDKLERLRIHFEANACTELPSPTTDSDGGGGVLSSRMDVAFGKLQGGVTELFARCDKLNRDAAMLNRLTPRFYLR